MGTEVIRISREFKCCAGCCWFASCCDSCSFEVVVEAPVGNIAGFVKQKSSFIKASYDILDEDGEVVVKVEGPCFICDGACCPCDNTFRVVASDGHTKIGKIVKEFNGFVKELSTNSDKFSITCKG
jgi:hypothetical protein